MSSEDLEPDDEGLLGRNRGGRKAGGGGGGSGRSSGRTSGRIGGRAAGSSARSTPSAASPRQARPRRATGGGGATRARHWTGTLRQRVAVARGSPQVVVKVYGHYQGAKRVLKHLLYMAREGEEKLHMGGGEEVVGRGEIEDLVAGWAAEFTTRTNGRDVTAMELSLPPQLVRTEEDRERALAASVAFLEREFGDRFEYAFAAHNDTDHYHVHVLVKRRGAGGELLATNKPDLARWRQGFAEAARERGFEVDASPRYARGKTRASASPEVEQMRRRGAEPEVDRRRRERSGPSDEVRQRAKEVNASERLAYARSALEVARESRGFVSAADRAGGLEMAGVLALYSARMDSPQEGDERRPGWAQARPLVVDVYKIMREESERLYGAELRRVSGVRNELAGELERSDRGAPEDQRAAMLEEARRLATAIADPERRRRAVELLERLDVERGRARGGPTRDPEEDLER